MNAIATITAALALTSCLGTSTTADAVTSIEMPMVAKAPAAPAATPVQISPLQAATIGHYAGIGVNVAAQVMQSLFMPAQLAVTGESKASGTPEVPSLFPSDEFETCPIDLEPSQPESTQVDSARRPSLHYRILSAFGGKLLEDPERPGELMSFSEMIGRLFTWLEDVAQQDRFCGSMPLPPSESGL